MNLVKVQRLDAIRLDQNDKTYFTEEGYLVDHPVLTSTGIFEYKNPDGTIRRELRLPENVFNEKSLKSYKGKPIIITHDAGAIDKYNVTNEQIGTILSEGYQDGEDVRAEIIIHDTDGMKECGLRELSLGYNLTLDETPGEWNGEPYDAIQKNIIINHLALVSTARAGEQARLNIDGKDNEEPNTLKGGKVMANVNNETTVKRTARRSDSDEAVVEKAVAPETVEETSEADGADTMLGGEAPATEEVRTDNQAILEALESLKKLLLAKVGADCGNTDSEDEEENTDSDDESKEEPKDSEEEENTDSDEEECDNSDSEEEEENTDADDKSQSRANADSADDIVRTRLSICRVGDKLHMDGLEDMSIVDAKKAIVRKVLPEMRLDGKDTAYINAAYDIAVAQANKEKDADYQRQQMSNGHMNLDSNDDNGFSAAQARRNMINRREGGDM